MAKHHPDLIMCRKQCGIAIGRLCEKCDGKCVICDSYVRPSQLARVCDECNYGSYQGRCVICGGAGISDAFYCKECCQCEKDRDGCPKIVNLGTARTDLFYERPWEDQAAVAKNRQELMIAIALEGPGTREHRTRGGCISSGPFWGQACIYKNAIRMTMRLQKNCHFKIMPINVIETEVHDVAISWAHPFEWQVGQVLYHGPAALKLPILRSGGGRHWVSLAQVVWVFQPADLCQVVTGQSWDKVAEGDGSVGRDWQQASVLGRPHKSRDAGNPFDVSRLDLLRLLARYVQAQLQLVASLAKERQMNSIMVRATEGGDGVRILSLQGTLFRGSGLTAAQLGLSASLAPRPSIIRASFFDLLMALWVDRHPHYQVVVPGNLRKLDSLNDAAEAHYSRRPLEPLELGCGCGTGRHTARTEFGAALGERPEFSARALGCLERLGGYSFQTVGLGEPFTGVGMKLFLYDRALKELVGRQIPANEPVLLLDAWDTLILGSAEEFYAKLEDMDLLAQNAILCGADRICAPEYKMAPKMERYFPDIATPWRYPNSGCICGSAAAVTAFIHGLVHGTEGGTYSEKDDDQLRVQEFLLNWETRGVRYPFHLDHECRMFQNMGEPECGWDFELHGSVPRVRNLRTGHQPLVVHGCGGHGRWFLSDIYRELELLEFLDVKPDDLASVPYAGLVAPGEQVTEEHWVEQPPWEFPFQAFEVIRGAALREEAAEAAELPKIGRFVAAPHRCATLGITCMCRFDRGLGGLAMECR
ncbi:unnamed protein product [Durusdinium trenchii]|uniref:PLOD1-3-like GT domain-containing protein n=1 Tax=Durusdinium trenchii TaxID=1381693 RepID=A0ABP0KR12_9DINO